MAFCLPKTVVDKFVKSIPTDISKLIKMTSEQRRAFFEKSVGVENAKSVNALFESKLILKNQQAGLINWVEKVANLKVDAKRDYLSRIQRMDKILKPEELNLFLEDLAAKRLGIEVSVEEAGRIMDLARDVEVKRQAIDKGGDPLDYGVALQSFKKQVGELKIQAEKKGILEKIKSPGQVIVDAGGVSKSILSSLDNSFFGRQGRRTLASNPIVWTKNLVKSFDTMQKSLRGGEPIDMVKAEIFSRPNALNGKYKAGKLDIGLAGEEAFPSSLPARIPVLGRLFKASEQTFNASALRMRADLADIYIKLAENKGHNMLDPKIAKDVLDIPNFMTGRGSLGKGEAIAKELNNLFFSIKKVKADWDFFSKPVKAKTKIGRQIATRNLLKDIGATGTFLYTMNLLAPEMIEFDPRSVNFLQLKFGKKRVDVSGGARSMITLASRLFPTKHNGKWGRWSKSSTTGKWTFLSDAKFGQRTGLDVAESYLEGKLSPLAGAIRDEFKGQTFDGEEATALNVIKGAVTPLPVQTYQELMEEDNSNIWGFMLAEELGFGVNVF